MGPVTDGSAAFMNGHRLLGKFALVCIFLLYLLACG